MTKYLSHELVGRSFERLSSRNIGGKTHMERTSALMYFLAVDAALRHFELTSLDLNPDSLEGRNSRKQVELEFIRLVLVGNSQGGVRQVTELGKIEEAGTHPEKRISSNFLTVPLKKASDQAEPFYYPNRPKCPLFKMGLAATGKKWGLSYHENWMQNFLSILTTIRGSTPTLDLAVFVSRDCVIEDSVADVFTALKQQLSKRFTSNLSNFLIQRIEKERVLAPDFSSSFSGSHVPFADFYKKSPVKIKKYSEMNKSELIERIRQLESTLKL